MPPISMMAGWPKTFEPLDPFWPPTAGISFVDINGGGYLEVIGNFRYKSTSGDTLDSLFAFDYMGNRLWAFYDGTVLHYPAFGDLDNDGANEIIFGSDKGINVLKGDGMQMPNFPFVFPNLSNSEVAVADVDGEGDLDIVFFAEIYNQDTTLLYVLDKNGLPLSGWPIVMPKYYFTHPAVGDIDNDGKKEIIYNTWNDSLYCFRYDGTIQPGFPVQNKVISDPLCGIGEVILCDIDNDNYVEIIFGSCTPWADTACLFIYRWNGSLQPGWPKYFSDHTVFHPTMYRFAIGDIDNDQKIDVVIPGTGRVMRLLDQNGDYLPGSCRWQSEGATNPLIANIDFTPEKEVICQSTNMVFSFYSNLQVCYGWPMKAWGTVESHCVADIDGDGFIELGVITGYWEPGSPTASAYMYIWKLLGPASEIEWGHTYYDVGRTCHYQR
ncbi:MAG: VCBS repeat-containing protein [candidate division WOR-3 bacterium]